MDVAVIQDKTPFSSFHVLWEWGSCERGEGEGERLKGCGGCGSNREPPSPLHVCVHACVCACECALACERWSELLKSGRKAEDSVSVNKRGWKSIPDVKKFSLPGTEKNPNTFLNDFRVAEVFGRFNGKSKCDRTSNESSSSLERLQRKKRSSSSKTWFNLKTKFCWKQKNASLWLFFVWNSAALNPEVVERFETTARTWKKIGAVVEASQSSVSDGRFVSCQSSFIHSAANSLSSSFIVRQIHSAAHSLCSSFIVQLIHCAAHSLCGKFIVRQNHCASHSLCS